MTIFSRGFKKKIKNLPSPEELHPKGELNITDASKLNSLKGLSKSLEGELNITDTSKLNSLKGLPKSLVDFELK